MTHKRLQLRIRSETLLTTREFIRCPEELLPKREFTWSSEDLAPRRVHPDLTKMLHTPEHAGWLGMNKTIDGPQPGEADLIPDDKLTWYTDRYRANVTSTLMA